MQRFSRVPPIEISLFSLIYNTMKNTILTLTSITTLVTSVEAQTFGVNEDASLTTPWRNYFNAGGDVAILPSSSGSGTLVSDWDLGNMWADLAGVKATLTWSTSENGQARQLGGGSFQGIIDAGEYAEFQWTFDAPIAVRINASQGLHPGEYFTFAEATYGEYNDTVRFSSDILGSGPGLQNTSTVAGSGAFSADAGDHFVAYNVTTATFRVGAEHTTDTLGGGGFGFALTDQTFAAESIPEPSSTALLGLGALGLIARRKR